MRFAGETRYRHSEVEMYPQAHPLVSIGNKTGPADCLSDAT